MDIRTAHALVRFGLGSTGEDTPRGDPAAWLLNQLHQPDWQPASVATAGIATTAFTTALPTVVTPNGTQSGIPQSGVPQSGTPQSGTPRFGMTQSGIPQSGIPRFGTARFGMTSPGVRLVNMPVAGVPSTEQGLAAIRADREDRANQTFMPGQSRVRALYQSEGLASVARAVETRTPFRERLVWFWTNHFTISLRQGRCAALAGAFVQEAIRPHVTGRFQDMVLAVARHPAMLIYLDNAGSVGPDSMVGQRSHRGLNENLARECMELHTVSPASGYTQEDVTSFARILTGWSVELKNDPAGFVFRPNVHEPGEQTLMGHRFPDGEEGGIEALRFLANHPAAHRFIATKLVRHFVADDPPPAAVRRIEAILRDTGGDLGAASAGLVHLDEAWTPGTKFRSPIDLVVAACRALGIGAATDPGPPYLAILAGLGQPLWTAPAPDGWPDNAAGWSGPEAMMRRVDWSYGFAQRVGDRDPIEIGDAVLGPLFRPATHEAMAHAGSRREAMTLLLTSPEFQRR
jgi:uncharacterized protein (DUF1800 family)